MPDTHVNYTVTAGGNAVQERLFPGTAHEMRTLYVRDGDDVVLVHVCASGNHPKMRARGERDGRIVFAFDGAVNFDPAKAGHMHDADFTLLGPDELRTQWRFWQDGRPAEHVANLHPEAGDDRTERTRRPAALKPGGPRPLLARKRLDLAGAMRCARRRTRHRFPPCPASSSSSTSPPSPWARWTR